MQKGQARIVYRMVQERFRMKLLSSVKEIQPREGNSTDRRSQQTELAKFETTHLRLLKPLQASLASSQKSRGHSTSEG